MMGIRTPSGQIAGGSDLRSVISMISAAAVPDRSVLYHYTGNPESVQSM
ncbi:MAG: hypothetical protein K2P73_16485 [Lachnospiraceae bacterium]|nr:hypothetical protein [Lachnospiraceae bacterium]